MVTGIGATLQCGGGWAGNAKRPLKQVRERLSPTTPRLHFPIKYPRPETLMALISLVDQEQPTRRMCPHKPKPPGVLTPRGGVLAHFPKNSNQKQGF